MLDNNSDIQIINICHMGFDVKVEVSPRWHADNLMHFALHGDIISDTGYKSHFVYRELYLKNFNDSIESLKSACLELVKTFFNERLERNPRLISELTQLSIF